MGKLFAKLIFFLSGWTLDDHLKADFRRSVIIAAPHTSNWDLLYSRAAFSLMEIPVKFTVKDDWMKFPAGILIRALGGIGINRSPKVPGQERQSAVEAMINLFTTNKELAIMITPEGTRKKVTKWKTGFYNVAVGAKVPIGLGYLDYKNKIAGIAKVFYPSGNMQKDMQEIMDFYRNIQAKYPEKFSVDEDYK